MSADNDQDVRGRLDAALGSITPRPVPFDAAIRQGRGIRGRRRAWIAAGLTAAAAAAVAVPAWLAQQLGTPAPAGPPAVTVSPPGPGSAPGLIASGTVGARHWRLVAQPPAGGKHCYVTAAGPSGRFCSSRLQHPAQPASLSLVNGTGNGLVITFGSVQPNVTRVDVRLADGQQLSLHPVLRYGVRYIAYAAGPDQHASSATAYTGDRELTSAVPLNLPGLTWFGQWLRPGQAALHRATQLLGTGSAGGAAWSMHEYAGPWGVCFISAQASGFSCFDASGVADPQGSLISEEFGGRINPGYFIHLDAVAGPVASVRLTLSTGQVIRPPVTAGVDGQKFLVYSLRGSQQVRRWTAYGTGGQQLGSGTVIGAPG